MTWRHGIAHVSWRCKLIAGAAALSAVCLSATPARAIDIACIEASKYKYLFQLYGGSRARFADYFRIDPSRLPDPEMCRAILVTGHIEPVRRGSADEDPDFNRLFRAIADNRGWLSAIYLSSHGGTVGTAMRLAQMTRMFWLKTYAPGESFVYTPDFLDPATAAEDLAAASRTYFETVQPYARIELPAGAAARCTSACTYPLAAGVDRHGTAYVHRGRRSVNQGQSAAEELTLAETVELLTRSEARVVALYRQMDAGEELIRLYQSTATTTAAPAIMARSPRFIADHLDQICKADVNAPVVADRGRVEQCVAAAHERERLSQYDKLCGDACDHAALMRSVGRRIGELVPDSSRATPAPN